MFEPWSLGDAAFKTATRHDRDDARRDAKAQRVPSGDPRTDFIEFARLEDQALANYLQKRLQSGVLVAFGMPEGGVDPVRIQPHHLQSLSLNLADSTATNKNSKIVFEGVHVYPRLLAPDAERSLDGRPLADVIRDDVLGDPELVVEFWRFPPPPPYLALPPSPDAREEERARAWEAEHGTPEAAERRAGELWTDWFDRVHDSPLPLAATKERLERLWWEQPIKVVPPPDAPDQRPRWRTRIGAPIGAPDAGIVAARLAAIWKPLAGGRLQARGRKLVDEETGAYGPPEIISQVVFQNRSTFVWLVHGDLVAMEDGKVVAKWSDVVLIDSAPRQQIPVDRAPRSAAKGNGQRRAKRDPIVSEGIAMMATPASSANPTAPASASDVRADEGEQAPKRNGGGRPREYTEEECAALFEAVRQDPEALKRMLKQEHVWEEAKKKSRELYPDTEPPSNSTLRRWGVGRGLAADLIQIAAANNAEYKQEARSPHSEKSHQPKALAAKAA